MPNWCTNTVTFSHGSERELDRLVKAYNENRLFSEFFPTPKELTEVSAPNSVNAEEMIAKYMNINVSSDSEGHKNVTVTASDDDAVKLAHILKNAGLGGDDAGHEPPGEITSHPEIEVVKTSDDEP